jgi:hypothetical protein
MSDGDDAYFSQAAHEMDFFSYIRMRYLDWQGRATSEALTYIAFNFGLTFWRITNALILTLLPLGLIQMVKRILPDMNTKRRFYLMTAAFISILFLDIEVIGYGAFWITGSTFYLWSITAGLWAAMPFVHLAYCQEPNRRCFIYAIPLGFIAAMGQEQIAAVVIVFGIISILHHYYKHRQISWLHVFEVAIMILSLLLVFLSPGTEARTQAEIENWMPQYSTMSTGNHIFITLQWILSSLATKSRMLFIMLWFTTAVILRSQKKQRPLTLIFTTIAALTALLSYFNIPWLSEMGIGITDFNQTVTKVATPTSLTAQNWIALIWWCILYIFTLRLLWLLWDSLKNKLFTLLLLLAATATMAIMYLSPTMYASGGRVLFVAQILLWLLILLHFARIEEKRLPLYLIIYLIGGTANTLTPLTYIRSFLS